MARRAAGGDARRDFYKVHTHCVYDLELDAALEPAVNAETLIASWQDKNLTSLGIKKPWK